MIIKGKDIRFELTVGAANEIEQICPGKDIRRLGEVFENKTYAEMMDVIAFMAKAMNKGYIVNQIMFGEPEQEEPAGGIRGALKKLFRKRKKFDEFDPSEIYAFSRDQIAELQAEILNAYGTGVKQSVRTESKKKETTGGIV